MADSLTKDSIVARIPGMQAFAEWMQAIANEIQHSASQADWVAVELKAAQLVKMCEMRRQRR